MATTSRSTTPRTEPFPPLEVGPRTPVSLPSISHTSFAARKDSARGPPLLSAALGRASLSPKPHSSRLSPFSSPAPLTGAAAMADVRRRRQQKAQEDARQTSPNPQATALSALMGSTGMSKATDAPSPSRVSEPMQRVAEKMQLPVITETSTERGLGHQVRISGGLSNGTSGPAAMTVTATDDGPPQFVDEPDSMTPNHSNHDEETHPGGSPEDEDSGRPFTYPGPIHPRDQLAPSRGMSLPGAGYDQNSPKTPTAKRHKCPYCSTDFTRHHNLKSHLLTHSQEKPYVCQTCQARFRRLHDLKRHTKLHTGERPHTCPKCGRRFARGDALARHNKGPGGCAGRRSSIGGEDDDGEGGDDTMDGLEYQDDNGNDDRDEDDMVDENGRRVSEPSRKRAHLETSRDAERAVYRQHSSTYPPPLGRVMRQEVGNMGPPQAYLPSSTVASPEQSGTAPPSANSSYSSQYYAPPPPPSMLQHGSITSSPKPISPGNPAQHRLSVSDATGLRNRSPSLTQQFQQDHFGRPTGPSGRPPPGHSYPPPQLPSLGSLAPTNHQPNRMVIQQGPPSAGPSMLHHQQHPPPAAMPGSNPSSMSSHGQSSGGSMREMIGPEPQDLWNYVRNLEQRFSRMQDEYELRISRLQEDLISLKGQVYAPR